MDYIKIAEEIFDAFLLGENNDDAYDQILEDNLVGVGNMINLGRDRTAIGNCDLVEYSAILDKKTCELCRWLDGSIFEVGSSEYNQYMPRIHNRCRCIYVYISREEANPPEPSFERPSRDLIESHGQLVGKPIPNTGTVTGSASASMIDIIAEVGKESKEDTKGKAKDTGIDEESEEQKERKDFGD
jgi:SPP1 gp7 family putative phage head morphogenesis protein